MVFAVGGNGGAILNDQGTVTLTHCTLSGNSAKFGGGIEQEKLGSFTIATAPSRITPSRTAMSINSAVGSG